MSDRHTAGDRVRHTLRPSKLTSDTLDCSVHTSMQDGRTVVKSLHRDVALRTRGQTRYGMELSPSTASLPCRAYKEELVSIPNRLGARPTSAVTAQ